VTEYKEAISILASITTPYDRSLSELHMLIALAYDNIVDAVDHAVEYAEKAKTILLAKVAQLEGLGAEKSESDEREITDIKELMSDVDMKVSLSLSAAFCESGRN
jgi:hypothetical protein